MVIMNEMYGKFIQIINQFLDDIQSSEPYVFRRSIRNLQPLLFTNKTRYKGKLSKKLRKYLQEFYVNENERNVVDEAMENDNSKKSLYKIIVQILR